MPLYKGTEGELIKISDAWKYTSEHVNCKDPNHDHHFVEAEFFGLKKFNKLMDECEGEPVGFRVYYGIRHEDHSSDDPCECDKEDGGKPTQRLIIVPVDANGKELTGSKTVRGLKKNMDSDEGLKDMPQAQGKVLANGPICPKVCGN